jgi:hypothetical protein
MDSSWYFFDSGIASSVQESRAKAFFAELAGLLTSVLMHGQHVDRQSSS